MQRLLKALVLISVLFVAAFAAPPKVGERAPDFRLPSDKGATISLKEYAGKSKLVLVFYRGYW